MIQNNDEFLKYLKWILESLETIKPEIITHKKKIGFPDVSMGNIEKEKRIKIMKRQCTHKFLTQKMQSTNTININL